MFYKFSFNDRLIVRPGGVKWGLQCEIYSFHINHLRLMYITAKAKATSLLMGSLIIHFISWNGHKQQQQKHIL